MNNDIVVYGGEYKVEDGGAGEDVVPAGGRGGEEAEGSEGGAVLS